MTLQELGQVIRQRREALGISIEDIAAQIKVSARILKAIEEGVTDGLPHAVYTKGFIRSFGAAVQIDPMELNEALERVFPPEAFDDAKPEAGPMVRSLPSSGIWQRIAAVLFLLLLISGVVGGAWYVAATYGNDIVELVKKPFSAVTPTPETSTLTVASASLGSVELPLQTSGGSESLPPDVPESSPSSGEHLTGLIAASTPAPAGAVVSGLADNFANPSSVVLQASAQEAHNVVIAAREACYLDIVADAEKAKRFILQPDETYPILFDTSLRLVVGNAGGVAISYNGKDMGEIGPKGKRKELVFP